MKRFLAQSNKRRVLFPRHGIYSFASVPLNGRRQCERLAFRILHVGRRLPLRISGRHSTSPSGIVQGDSWEPLLKLLYDSLAPRSYWFSWI